MVRVAVVGAGIIGLSTAFCIKLEHGSTIAMTIIADRFLEETTSDGAGGIFRPDDRFIIGVEKSKLKYWCQTSFDYFHRLGFSNIAADAGISRVSGYQLFNDERTDPSYKDIVYEFRHMTDAELDGFTERYKFGYFCTTLYVDTRRYLKFLTNELTKQQVKFVKRNIKSFNELTDEFDIVINCSGYGAKEICHDSLMKPIRGQMIRVRAPWIKHFYYTDDNCYIIPNSDTIVLGGTRQFGNDKTDIDLNDKDGIWQRCLRICPSLAQAEILWHWAGVRPNREPVRVETQTVRVGDKELQIIHNYGHGGNGVSLSWGTAVDAARQFSLLINQIRSRL